MTTDFSFSNGFTICLKVQFHIWNERCIFKTDFLTLILHVYTKRLGSLSVQGKLFYFDWSDTDLQSATSRNTFCITNDITGSIAKLLINGNVTLQINLTEQIFPENYISVGNCENRTLVGKISDFNIWDKPLSDFELKSISNDCNSTRLNSPNIIDLSNQESNLIKSGTVEELEILRSDFCLNSELKGMDNVFMFLCFYDETQLLGIKTILF